MEAELRIELDAPGAVRVGETLTGRLAIAAPAEEVRVHRVQLQLLRRAGKRRGAGKGQLHVRRVAQKVLPGLRLAPGAPPEAIPFTLGIPRGEVPSHGGRLFDVEWEVQARLVGDEGGEVVAGQPVQVHPEQAPEPTAPPAGWDLPREALQGPWGEAVKVLLSLVFVAACFGGVWKVWADSTVGVLPALVWTVVLVPVGLLMLAAGAAAAITFVHRLRFRGSRITVDSQVVRAGETVALRVQLCLDREAKLEACRAVLRAKEFFVYEDEGPSDTDIDREITDEVTALIERFDLLEAHPPPPARRQGMSAWVDIRFPLPIPDEIPFPSRSGPFGFAWSVEVIARLDDGTEWSETLPLWVQPAEPTGAASQDPPARNPLPQGVAGGSSAAQR